MQILFHLRLQQYSAFFIWPCEVKCLFREDVFLFRCCYRSLEIRLFFLKLCALQVLGKMTNCKVQNVNIITMQVPHRLLASRDGGPLKSNREVVLYLVQEPYIYKNTIS